MRVRVTLWMVGILLSGIVAEAATVNSNRRIRKWGMDISLTLVSEIRAAADSGQH
jgi:hypothetical protein